MYILWTTSKESIEIAKLCAKFQTLDFSENMAFSKITGSLKQKIKFQTITLTERHRNTLTQLKHCNNR